jgi:hypothetical protein
MRRLQAQEDHKLVDRLPGNLGVNQDARIWAATGGY